MWSQWNLASVTDEGEEHSTSGMWPTGSPKNVDSKLKKKERKEKTIVQGGAHYRVGLAARASLQTTALQ